ncbi:hypothetical protein DSO57_1018353 [Entomophthora muscae]|uniref:Uncharacterized protein n=1 Tax=Entomophthora muscae TaxID=34485 RepID=A0ACC2SH60_9FUNG|nr:hypothetical protein DSO57_1018353 [Entomophthora muscae]
MVRFKSTIAASGQSFGPGFPGLRAFAKPHPGKLWPWKSLYEPTTMLSQAGSTEANPQDVHKAQNPVLLLGQELSL